MGEAKKRGTYEYRKSNARGLQSNHLKGIFDYCKIKQQAMRLGIEQDRIKRLGNKITTETK